MGGTKETSSSTHAQGVRGPRAKMVQGTDYAYTHIYTSDTDIHRIKENKKLETQNAQSRSFMIYTLFVSIPERQNEGTTRVHSVFVLSLRGGGHKHARQRRELNEPQCSCTPNLPRLNARNNCGRDNSRPEVRAKLTPRLAGKPTPSKAPPRTALTWGIGARGGMLNREQHSQY